MSWDLIDHPSFLLYDQVQRSLHGNDDCLDALKEQDEFYSPLGKPDWKDLPSFAHQMAQGMVCTAKSKSMWLKWSIVVYVYVVFVHFTVT